MADKQPTIDIKVSMGIGAWLNGVPYDYMKTMAGIESSFDSSAVNKHTKATGLYQMLPAAAHEVGLPLAARTNPLASSIAAGRYTNRNLTQLRKRGIAVDLNTQPELGYLAHQQGAAGLAAIIAAAKNDTEVSARIRKHMNANGGAGKTPKEFLEFWKLNYKRIEMKYK